MHHRRNLNYHFLYMIEDGIQEVAIFLLKNNILFLLFMFYAQYLRMAKMNDEITNNMYLIYISNTNNQ